MWLLIIIPIYAFFSPQTEAHSCTECYSFLPVEPRGTNTAPAWRCLVHKARSDLKTRCRFRSECSPRHPIISSWYTNSHSHAPSSIRKPYRIVELIIKAWEAEQAHMGVMVRGTHPFGHIYTTKYSLTRIKHLLKINVSKQTSAAKSCATEWAAAYWILSSDNKQQTMCLCIDSCSP